MDTQGADTANRELLKISFGGSLHAIGVIHGDQVEILDVIDDGISANKMTNDAPFKPVSMKDLEDLHAIFEPYDD